MQLSHFSTAKEWRFRQSVYTQGEQWEEIGKPNGLWLSVDGEDDWLDWCLAESYRIDALAQRHVFEIADPARILHIKTAAELDEFSDRFARPGFNPHAFRIAWSTVAREHGGVIIAPYQWARRLHATTRWYYGWDCASGCIWDLECLRFVRSESAAQMIEARERKRAEENI